MTPIRHHYAALIRRAHRLSSRLHHLADRAHGLAARATTRRFVLSERGSATAEYAIAALAAAAFAALLIAVVSSPEIRGLLTGIISKALNTK